MHLPRAILQDSPGPPVPRRGSSRQNGIKRGGGGPGPGGWILADDRDEAALAADEALAVGMQGLPVQWDLAPYIFEPRSQQLYRIARHTSLGQVRD